MCSPAFNHKIGNAAHNEVSGVLFFHKISPVEETTREEMDNGKAPLRENVFLMIFTGAPIYDGGMTDPITTEIITLRCDLTMF